MVTLRNVRNMEVDISINGVKLVVSINGVELDVVTYSSSIAEHFKDGMRESDVMPIS